MRTPEMDYKVFTGQFLRGTLARRFLLKTTFLFTLAMVTISFIQITSDGARNSKPFMMNFHECPLNVAGFNPRVNLTGFLTPMSSFVFPLFGASPPCRESENLTVSVFKELMEKDLLDSGARALCIGEGSALAVSALQELGFGDVFSAERHPFFSLLEKRFVCELDFVDNHFDFVFSKALDRDSVPALLVSEIERILRPGGTGALLVGARNFYSGSLVRSATPVSSFLRSSNVVHVCGFGSFTVVVFKKKFDNVALFEHYRLPDKCPSVIRNKPLIKFIEPLVRDVSGQVETKLSYLPKFVNMSSRKRLIYINVGAGELVNSSIENMLKPNYPIHSQALDVYVVDHNASVLSSYVKKPGITFVYHPGLGGDKASPIPVPDEHLSAPPDEGRFDFIRWFKEMVTDGDFVVLMMNARAAELKLLFELFETGAICRLDELFLRCSDHVDCKSYVCGDCTSLFRSLRNGGVFAHQWWGN